MTLLLPVALVAWGVWCLVGAPPSVAKYRQRMPRWTRFDADWSLVSPLEWRCMGALWCLVGLYWLFLEV
jgi:hypothetical protein